MKKLLLFALIPVLAIASCQLPDGETDNDDSTLRAVYFPFIIDGETAATNIKLVWQKQAGVNRYEILRDGVPIGNINADRFDDYNLQPDRTYTYQIKAYLGDSVKAVSSKIKASTFTPGIHTWRQVVRTGARTQNPNAPVASAAPSGRKFGGKYYEFRTQSSSGNITFQARSSPNGFDNWTGYVTLTTDGTTTTTLGTYVNPDGSLFGTTGAKLEGIGWHTVLNKKVVLAAHREPAGSSYALGHLILISFYPGETYPEYANYPGNAKVEITYDDRPFGLDSRDMSIYVDNDGKAYAFCSGLSNINVHLLDAEWTEPIEHYNTMFPGQRRETPHVHQAGDYYFLFSSRQNGWLPTQTRYVWMRGSIGATASLPIDVGSQGSYGSQFNHTQVHHGTKRTSYGMSGQRWAANWPTEYRESSIARLVPLAFDRDFAAVAYFTYLQYYEDYALVGVQAGRHLSLGKSVTFTGNANPLYANPAVITDGADMGSDNRFFRAADQQTPYTVTIDLQTPAVIKEITLSAHLVGGSDSAYRFMYHASNDRQNWTMLVDGSDNLTPGFLIHPVSNTNAFRYVRMTVNGVVNANPDNGNAIGGGANWADGIIELAVYGTPN